MKLTRKQATKFPAAATAEEAIQKALDGVNLRFYDIILVNSSAGKDSQVMLDWIVEVARELGILDRLHVVHCDLGRVEWAGTRELAERQAKSYGLPFHVVSRPQGDLLHQVEFERKMWPGFSTRYCTSDHKSAQVRTLITQLVDDFNQIHQAHIPVKQRRQVQVLNCIGIRGQESDKRAQKPVLETGIKGTSGVRQIDAFHPLKHWSEEQIWERIRSRNLEYHKAYDLGMPRLSCVFCIYAPEQALLLAGYHNRELLKTYVGVEQRTGHSFRQGEPLIQIQAQLEAGYVPAGPISSDAWLERCAA